MLFQKDVAEVDDRVLGNRFAAVPVDVKEVGAAAAGESGSSSAGNEDNSLQLHSPPGQDMTVPGLSQHLYISISLSHYN
jgi:hypothetical protein